MVLSDGTRVLAKELTEHRIAVVLRGEGLSDAISCTDPGTTEEGKKVSGPRALDGSEKAQKTADALWEFTKKAYGILKEHPINKERIQKGLKPANIILTRGAGQKTEMVSLKAGTKSGPPVWQEIKQWEVLPGWQVWITISGTALQEALTRTLWERPGWRQSF